MKKLEDAKIKLECSRYKRFLGQDELKDFSIKIDEKRFNEEVFENNSNYKIIDLTEYNELSLESSLSALERIKKYLLLHIETEKKKALEQIEIKYMQQIFDLDQSIIQKKEILKKIKQENAEEPLI